MNITWASGFAALTRCDVHKANSLPHLASALLCQNAFVGGPAYAGGNQKMTKALGQRAWLFESAPFLRSFGVEHPSNSHGIIVVVGHVAFSSCAVLVGLSKHADYVLASGQLDASTPRHITSASAGVASMQSNIRIGLAIDTDDGLPTCLYTIVLLSVLRCLRSLGIHVFASPNLACVCFKLGMIPLVLLGFVIMLHKGPVPSVNLLSDSALCQGLAPMTI